MKPKVNYTATSKNEGNYTSFPFIDIPGADSINYKIATLFFFIFCGVLFAITIGTGESINNIGRVFLAITFFTVIISVTRLCAALTPRKTPSRVPEIPAESHLSFSLLIAVHDEAHMIPQLTSYLQKIDYPIDKLEICFIAEAHDIMTIDAIRAVLVPPFRLLIVPPGGRRTKPNALNYALHLTHGDIISIYDAEDRPDPEQIKIAAQMFIENPDQGALQAPLVFFNADDNSLTRQFAIEYAALFYTWLPFLCRIDLPFPLGGTSNHIRRSALETVDGWDAANVTEDADLSFRLAASGWKFGYIHPATDEEVVDNWTAWYNQRTRWMKGFMMTWLVHMRSMLVFNTKPKGHAIWGRMLALQLTVGATLLSALFYLPYILLSTITLIWLSAGGKAIAWPSIFFFFTLILGFTSGLFLGAAGIIRSKQYKLFLSLPLIPLYWLAMFFPAVKAIGELRRAPFYWNKTHHGLRHRNTD